MERVINCSILTPERLIYEGEVGFAVVQAHDGEMGFLYGHSPLISKLGIGEIRLNNPKSVDYLVVEGGVVEIKNNKLIILAEKAFRKSDLSAADLDLKMKELDSQMSEMAVFSEDKFILKLEKDKLKVRLKVARR
ncbi:MAG TPA: ATP synthase F1 subunit epsilon [Spirochaetota bacterium]|mgnify:CR=1 FL=1|nr:ATP synthase F1 subunit epsilon [Spirochaetota bacterium]HPS86376.1 ATP synthase F1 subunit epsilon [Spirochaetota bacterium]